MSKKRVLFLCTGNSARSQMAEGLVNHFLNDQWEAFSAGTAPSGYVHPLAVQALAGRRLRELGFIEEPAVKGYFVKEVVLPFARFPGMDARLGPEMRSTGEGMGIGRTFGEAFAKAQISCGGALPLEGTVFLSVNDNDKRNLMPIARELAEMGFRLLATQGTAAFLKNRSLTVEAIHKVSEGRPHAVDYIVNGEVDLVVNTPLGKEAFTDGAAIRRAAVAYGVSCITTLSAAAAAMQGIRALRHKELTVRSLQEIHCGTR